MRAAKRGIQNVATIKPTITIDGNFSDWIASERIDYGDVTGYSLYAEAQNGFLHFDLNARPAWRSGPIPRSGSTPTSTPPPATRSSASPEAPNTTSTSRPTAPPRSITGADGQTLVLDNIPIAYSADHTQVELAIPLASIGNPNNPIDVLYDVNNSTFGPTSYTNQPYVAPNADVTRTPTHKVAIVYSDTTAANYFRGLGDAAGAPSTAYSDLFMAAQNQARMAGVSYDVIDESQLTNVNNLIGYDALIFPAMTNVNTAQLPAIMSALTSAVYDYHIPIITSGDFLTNDQTGAALRRQSLRQHGDLAGSQPRLRRQQRRRDDHRRRRQQPDHDRATPRARSSRPTAVSATPTTSPSGNTPEDVLVNQNVAGVGNAPGCGRDHGRRRHQRAFRHPGSAGRQQSVVERHPERGAGHHSRVSRCIPRAMPASLPRAWTWTRRSSPPMCRRQAAGPGSMTS